MAGEKLLPRVKLLTEWRLTIELQPNLPQLQSTLRQEQNRRTGGAAVFNESILSLSL